jgi:hypothetical protein
MGGDTCASMFSAALVRRANLWNQPRYLKIDDWIKKIWYLYMMDYDSAIQKNEIKSFAGK